MGRRNHSLVGLGFAQFAVSSANPALVVAAASTAAEAALVNAPNAQSRVQGLYYSGDAGLSWHLATLMDGNIVTQSTSSGSNAATAVVWNPVRRAFLRRCNITGIQFGGWHPLEPVGPAAGRGADRGGLSGGACQQCLPDFSRGAGRAAGDG